MENSEKPRQSRARWLTRTPEGRNLLLAGVLTLIWAALIVAIVQQVVGLWTDTLVFTLTGLGVAALGLLFFRSLTRRYGKRFRAKQAAFPPAWEQPVSQAISGVEEEISQIYPQVQQFMTEKVQTAIGQKPNETLRVALAAAMRWPIRYFPQWDYPTLLEVLWYPISFVEEAKKHDQIRERLNNKLAEVPAISAMAVSAPDLQALLEGSLGSKKWAASTFGIQIELPESIKRAPLQLLSLNYINAVIHQGLSSGRLQLDNFEPSWDMLLAASSQGFYGSEKAFQEKNLQLYEAVSFVFQSSKSLKWRRAIADLAWQRIPILGPAAPQMHELT